jgi:phosphate starvation-inducible PhoH-like protein
LSKKQRSLKFAKKPSNIATFTKPVKKTAVSLIPKSINQESYITQLLDDHKRIVFAIGPAGTGKTMLAMLAAIKAYKEGQVEKIILTRPAVGTDDERHGFLPGDINAKMEPWTRPLFDVLHEYYSPQDTAKMLDEQIIEISPLAFMRGRNFKNAYIVADEVQNTTVGQMKMLLTRLGENCKLVATGDIEQTDITRNNGLKHIMECLNERETSMIAMTAFTQKDVQRSEVVKEVLTLYA